LLQLGVAALPAWRVCIWRGWPDTRLHWHWCWHGGALQISAATNLALLARARCRAHDAVMRAATATISADRDCHLALSRRSDAITAIFWPLTGAGALVIVCATVAGFALRALLFH